MESNPARDADGNLTGKLADAGATALYEAAPGVTAQQIADFFVGELKDDWCHKTSESYAYENGEFVDGPSLEAIFQGHGSTVLMTTHQMLAGGQAFRIAVGPTYKKDPDIDFCEH